MRFSTNRVLGAALAVACAAPHASAQTYTPTEYRITLFQVELSTDGNNWVPVLNTTQGRQVDLVDPTAFSNALGNSAPVPAGTYTWIRMTLGKTLVWSHPQPPVARSSQSVTVNGPSGPNPDQMTVYFATHDQGGRPQSDGGGDATRQKPLLLGAPAQVVSGGTTALRIIFAVTGTLKDSGGGRYDLGPPRMFFVADNGSASSLSGTFNSVLYNTTKRVESNTVQEWSFLSGHGTLAFDGRGSWTWTGKTNSYDLRAASGSVQASVTRTGRYGVNADGSFWMTAKREPGTLHGAISSDGKIMFASMYDSASSHMMFFGVQRATNAAISSMTGNYFFTMYGSAIQSGQLRYRSSFGIVNANGLGAIQGTSNVNELAITSPLSNPVIQAPTARLGDPANDTLAVSTTGVLTSTGGQAGGGLLESAEAGTVGFDFHPTYSPRHEFGFFVKRSTPGTFTAASLNGTYYGGHFGDTYSSDNGGEVDFFSGFFKVTFNGQGGATVTVLENREGTIQVNTFQQTYTVQSSIGVVAFRDPNGDDSPLLGAIGPGARSFILTAPQKLGNNASDKRFLGLGLKQ